LNERPRLLQPLLPDSWTPAQALAAFQMLDLLRDQLWLAYGPAIQRALRADRHPRRLPGVRPHNRRQLTLPFESDPPF
jgi:hypothetical protein